MLRGFGEQFVYKRSILICRAIGPQSGADVCCFCFEPNSGVSRCVEVAAVRRSYCWDLIAFVLVAKI